MKKLVLLLLLFYIKHVNAQCPITITGNNSVCVGSCTIFAASGASSYTWAPGGATTSTISVCPNFSATYTVTGTTGTCTSTQTVFVSVNPNPTVTANSATICVGNSTNLSVAGASTYSWSPSYGLNTTVGSQVVASPSVTTSYTITGTVGSCTATTTSIVTVNSCADVNQFSSNKISIYPNPASDQLFIDASTTGKLTVDFYDVNGRHVFSVNVSDKSNIDVTNLNEGIYSMTIKRTDRVINKKLVILR